MTTTSEAVDPELSPTLPRPNFAVVGAAFVGGALGTLARYGFDRGWPEPDGVVPHTTNLINTSGAFAIGIAATILAHTCPERRALRAFIVTGVLGGWTTMSALAVADARLASIDGAFMTVVAMAVSLALGVAAAWSGVLVARRVWPLRPGGPG